MGHRSWTRSVRATGTLTIFNEPTVAGVWRNALDLAVRHLNVLSDRLSLGVRYTLSQQRGSNVTVTVGHLDEQISNRGAHGLTRKYAHPTSGEITRARVILPHSTHARGIKLVVCAHELVHAAGMGHSTYGDNDLMNEVLTVDGEQLETQNRRRMPPIWMSPSTAATIRGLWSN